jgi:hypothetical protein
MLSSNTKLQATIREGLLKPYLPFGRLGQMNFSRRTFFIDCRTDDGVRFWYPVDLAILPRYEVAPKGEMAATPDGGSIKLVVRNNSSSTLAGRAYLKLAQHEFPVDVKVSPRSERECTVDVPSNLFALFSPGDNHAVLTLPGLTNADLTVVASNPFAASDKLKEFASSRIVHISLPEQSLKSDTDWRQFREFYSYGHMPWAWSKPPMESLAGKTELTVPDLPGVSFKLVDRKLIPVSWKYGSPECRIDLPAGSYKKLYLLVVPFLDNHDTYSQVGRVSVRFDNGGVITKVLRFPGDLDWWCPEEVVGDFSTARKPRSDRFGLLSLLKPNDSDWKEAKPAVYPQPEFWATCLPVKTRTSVMSVIEVDLGQLSVARSVSLSTIGVDPAFGLVAVSAEKSSGDQTLAGTAFFPPVEFQEPRTIMEFTRAGDLQGWRLEGDAFSVCPFPSLFTTPTLNSLGKLGESATGKAFSPDFTIGPADKRIILQMQGGNSRADDGPGTLQVRLVDSKTGELLHKLLVHGSHLLRDEPIPVEKWQGRVVHLELVDEVTDVSYSWVGVRKVTLSPK